MGGVGDKDSKAKHVMRAAATTVEGGKPHVYELIGRRLRDFYDEVAQQPVPDRFVELLQRLDSKTTSEKDG